MSRARALLAPVIIAAAAWCAVGRIAVASPDAATVRVAMLGPWWVPVIAFAAALVVPAWRRDPRLAFPALVSTLPWWPVPLPAVALVWTGPLAWAPIAVALAVAMGVDPLRRLSRALGADAPSRATAIAGVLTFACGAAAAWSAAPRVPSTDEPHYLLITQSLLEDHDLRVENNRRQGDYHSYFAGDLAKSDYLVTGVNGEIYSIHAPGLPALVLPAFALFGYRGAEVTVLGLSAIAGMLVWRIGWLLTADPRAAWFAWAAVALSVTWLAQSFTIFPDGPAACACAAATWLLVSLDRPGRSVRTASVVIVSACLAALPWLHTRLAVLAAGLGLAIAARLVREPEPAAGARLRRLLAFVAVPVASAAAWFWFFHAIYGTFNPAAPYGDTSGPAGTHVQNVPGGTLALLFDGQFGVLAYTPVLAVAAIGWWRAMRGSHRLLALETLAIAAVTIGAAMTYWMWWAGNPAPPARFLAVVLPLGAVPLAIAWVRSDAGGRRLLLALLGVSVAIAAVAFGVDRAGLVWNDRDAQAHWLRWLGPVVNLRRAWPSFFWALDVNGAGPDHLASEWPFAIHAAIWTGLWVGSWIVARRVMTRRAASPRGWRLAIGAWLFAGLTLTAVAGWWWTGTTGLDAASAQAAILAGARRGVRIERIGAFEVGRATVLPGWIAIDGSEPGRLVDPPPSWFEVSEMPAGDYEVQVRLKRPTDGTLSAEVGALQMTFAMSGRANALFPLRLTAAARVAIVPDDALRADGGRVRLFAK